MNERYGPWAVVAGASDGIGAAFARALAARGLNVVLIARRRALLDEVASGLSGVDTRVVVADLSTTDGLAAVTGTIQDLDVGLLVCNAALSRPAPFLELTAAELDAMLDLNCRAAAHLSHVVGGRLSARGRGGIILLSSLAGDRGAALIAHYAATKAYLRVLAEGLWAELRPHGVDVLACCPGMVATPTYARSRPAPPSPLVPPAMAAEEVVRQALAALGRRPVVIPGLRNRLASAAAIRLLPRRAAMALVSRHTRALYPTGSRRPAPEDGPDG